MERQHVWSIDTPWQAQHDISTQLPCVIVIEEMEHGLFREAAVSFLGFGNFQHFSFWKK